MCPVTVFRVVNVRVFALRDVSSEFGTHFFKIIFYIRIDGTLSTSLCTEGSSRPVSCITTPA
jgi:hypothetical protein